MGYINIWWACRAKLAHLATPPNCAFSFTDFGLQGDAKIDEINQAAPAALPLLKLTCSAPALFSRRRHADSHVALCRDGGGRFFVLDWPAIEPQSTRQHMQKRGRSLGTAVAARGALCAHALPVRWVSATTVSPTKSLRLLSGVLAVALELVSLAAPLTVLSQGDHQFLVAPSLSTTPGALEVTHSACPLTPIFRLSPHMPHGAHNPHFCVLYAATFHPCSHSLLVPLSTSQIQNSAAAPGFIVTALLLTISPLTRVISLVPARHITRMRCLLLFQPGVTSDRVSPPWFIPSDFCCTWAEVHPRGSCCLLQEQGRAPKTKGDVEKSRSKPVQWSGLLAGNGGRPASCKARCVRVRKELKEISPRTRGKPNPALQFPSCPLDAASALRDGAYSMRLATGYAAVLLCGFAALLCCYAAIRLCWRCD
jgi:hypothetical protein